MILVLLAFWFSGLAADVGGDVLFELGKPASEWALCGGELALTPSFANPASLPFRQGWELVSSYLSPLSAGHFGMVALAGPFVSAQGFLFHAQDGPGLAYRAEGAALSLGVAVGSLGMGARARLLHPALPEQGLGFSLDVGLLWQGIFSLGAVAESVWAQAPFPGEAWPLDLSLALVLPIKLPGFTFFLGVAARDLLTIPILSGAAGFQLLGFAFLGSISTTGIALGGSFSWSMFRLEWAFSAHPHLPGSFCVSLALRWP